MKTNLTINETVLEGIHDFVTTNDKKGFTQLIDSLCESVVKSGFLVEFDLSEEIGALYDVKRLINSLPFSPPRENA